MSNAKNEVPGAKEYKILCLIDTDALATTISVSSSTKNRLLCIKRWHEDQNTHKIGLLDIDSPLYQPTEIEEVLEPQLFYTALETCINKYGTDSEKNAFGAFELDGSVEFSRIKGDNSMLNHLGNGRNIREDKKTIMDFIEKMKSQIASEYVQLPKTGRQLSWVDTIKNLLS